MVGFFILGYIFVFLEKKSFKVFIFNKNNNGIFEGILLLWLVLCLNSLKEIFFYKYEIVLKLEMFFIYYLFV